MNDWDQVDQLLRYFMFKELVVLCTVKGYNYKLAPEKWGKHASKLEVGVLGLLWCSGNSEQKARYFA